LLPVLRPVKMTRIPARGPDVLFGFKRYNLRNRI
jgi:hypothetical protein